MPERPGDMDERDVDARFASIIAGWDLGEAEPAPGRRTAEPDAGPASAVTDLGPTAPPEPAVAGPPAAAEERVDEGTSEGTHEGAAGHGPPVGKATPGPEPDEPPAPATPRSPWVTPAPLDVVVPVSAWRAAEARDEGAEADADSGDEHFEPPEVVLPPQEDLHFWGAVIGLVGGPLLLLYVVFARPFHSTRWFFAAVLVSLVGFALLILRQPKHRDPTSGDDGARV